MKTDRRTFVRLSEFVPEAPEKCAGCLAGFAGFRMFRIGTTLTDSVLCEDCMDSLVEQVKEVFSE